MKKNAALEKHVRVNNARWYMEALWDFWLKHNGGEVQEQANKDYRVKNVGGGKTRGENAKIILEGEKGNIGLAGITNLDGNPNHGSAIWEANVTSQESGGRYNPHLKVEAGRISRANSDLTQNGSVTGWSCQCWDFKKHKKPCKHILALTLVLHARAKKGSR